MCIKTIKTLHLHSGAELILHYVQFIWALSPTSRSVWRKLTIRKLCIKVLLSFYTISFRKRHMESSVHSHCGNSCLRRPLSWELPLPVSSCTPQQFMFGDTKNCLYFITDFTYSLAARSVLWRLQDCEFLVVRCSYCSYIIFPESPKLHYWERWDLVAGPLKEGTLHWSRSHQPDLLQEPPESVKGGGSIQYKYLFNFWRLLSKQSPKILQSLSPRWPSKRCLTDCLIISADARVW